jgi:hypothetical protein
VIIDVEASGCGAVADFDLVDDGAVGFRFTQQHVPASMSRPLPGDHERSDLCVWERAFIQLRYAQTA